MSRTRGYCFTLNNYTQSDIDHLTTVNKQVGYLCFGKETAPSTGTIHLQGYVHFLNAKTLPQVKKFLNSNSAHVEGAKGSALQNKTYCSKGNDFFEYGTLPQAGSRTDIHTIKDMVDKGANMSDLLEVTTSYQALKTAELLMKYQKPVQRNKPSVKWYYGETGSGKTKRAWDELGYDNTWISGKNLKWWNGYSGQKNIIIDDFRGDFCTFHELLRILDRYPYSIEIKGSSQWLAAEKIIITSAYHPRDIYETREDIQQLLRRIDVIECMKNTEVETTDTEVKVAINEIMVTKKLRNTEVGGNTNPALCDEIYKLFF